MNRYDDREAEMRYLNVGILGCGVISRTYAGDIARFFPQLRIAACADLTSDLAKKLAEEFGIPKVYETGEMLRDPEIDIVINLTPPQAHTELNRKIIEAGKHLFCEKPFAHTPEEAQELLDLADRKGVQAGSAPDTFLSSGLQSVRYYLDAGLIGKPFFITANMTTFGVETWHPNPRSFYAKGSGPQYDMAPYYLAALISLAGPIERIAAFSARPSETRRVYVGELAGTEIPAEVDTHYSAVMRMRSGVIVNLNVSYDIYRSNLPMFEIFGDGGTLSYPDPNFGGGAPKVYRKEQFIDPVYRDTEEARQRKETFYELPELFPRPKDYSRGIGVADLAHAIETGGINRTRGMIVHVIEAITGLMKAAETGAVYEMKSTCERPEPMKAGAALGEF